jgi:hypothetical protein
VRTRHLLLLQSTLIALVFLLFFGSMASADQLIRLMPGFATLLRLDRPVGTVIVGNPDVADATVQSEKTVVLTAKKIPGDTNVIILDSENNVFFRALISVGGQSVGKVEIHTKGRQLLHEYYAYNCTPVCARVKDDLEGFPRRVVTSTGGGVTTTVEEPVLPPEAPSQQGPLQQAPPTSGVGPQAQ